MTAEHRPPLLTIHTIPGDGEVTLRVAGEIDMSTAELLREALLAAIRHHDSTVRLDMADVSFMDSTGLAVLIFSHRRITQEGGRLILDRPNARVTRVLQVSGTDRLLDIQVELPAVPRVVRLSPSSVSSGSTVAPGAV